MRGGKDGFGWWIEKRGGGKRILSLHVFIFYFVLRPFGCLLKSSNPSVVTGGNTGENYSWLQTPQTNLN